MSFFPKLFIFEGNDKENGVFFYNMQKPAGTFRLKRPNWWWIAFYLKIILKKLFFPCSCIWCLTLSFTHRILKTAFLSKFAMRHWPRSYIHWKHFKALILENCWITCVLCVNFCSQWRQWKLFTSKQASSWFCSSFPREKVASHLLHE